MKPISITLDYQDYLDLVEQASKTSNLPDKIFITMPPYGEHAKVNNEEYSFNQSTSLEDNVNIFFIKKA